MDKSMAKKYPNYLIFFYKRINFTNYHFDVRDISLKHFDCLHFVKLPFSWTRSLCFINHYNLSILKKAFLNTLKQDDFL